MTWEYGHNYYLSFTYGGYRKEREEGEEEYVSSVYGGSTEDPMVDLLLYAWVALLFFVVFCGCMRQVRVRECTHASRLIAQTRI